MLLVRRLAREEGGFSLPELLVTLSIGMVVLLAAFGLMEFTMRRAGDVQDRVESLQRARLAMDHITRQLRSQVCMSSYVAPMATARRDPVAGSYREEVSFYASLGDGADDPATPGEPPPPEKRTLRYEPAERTIYEDVRVGTVAGGELEPEVEYPTSPDRTRVLATGIAPDGAQPIFSYFAFTAEAAPTPTEALATPLSPGSLERVARIEVRFDALVTDSADPTRGSTVLHDQVYVRAADPNDPSPIPTCA